MDLSRAIKERKSVRKYSHKKPDWRKILRALDLVRFTPSAGNYFVTKFILVSDEEKIRELARACQQDFVSDAPYAIVVVSDDSKLIRSYGKRGRRYTSQQAGAAIQNLLLALTEQKLAAVWVGYFYENQIKEILKIPDDMIVEAVIPVGEETKLRSKRQKKQELDNILYFDKWGNKLMAPRTRIRTDAL